MTSDETVLAGLSGVQRFAPDSSLQKGLGLMSNVYRMPVGYFRGRGAVTNTVSTTPYRSAGRPEAIFVIERLIDLAADQLWLDPVALRRRNMSQPATQPYANPLGITYDSGRYEDAMDAALALADWDGFSVRRTGARKRAGHRARQPIPEPLPRMRAVKEAFLREE